MNPCADLLRRHPVLEECLPAIEQAFALLRDSFSGGNKALLCGNGGSAADADHWSAELLKGFSSTRPLTWDAAARLPEPLRNRLQGGLPAIPLTAFQAFSTAFANDVDGTLSYAQLVWALGQPGDVLIGISTSGKAANVLAAMEAARAKDMKTLALTGRGGGMLAGQVDCCIRVPADVTHEIQELHLPIYHALSLMLEKALFPDAPRD